MSQTAHSYQRLLNGIIICFLRATLKCGVNTYSMLGFCSFSPLCRWPLLFEVEGLEGLADNSCWGSKWELDPEFCQIKMIDGILLARDATQWSIYQHLQEKRNIINVRSTLKSKVVNMKDKIFRLCFRLASYLCQSALPKLGRIIIVSSKIFSIQKRFLTRVWSMISTIVTSFPLCLPRAHRAIRPVCTNFLNAGWKERIKRLVKVQKKNALSPGFNKITQISCREPIHTHTESHSNRCHVATATTFTDFLLFHTLFTNIWVIL